MFVLHVPDIVLNQKTDRWSAKGDLRRYILPFRTLRHAFVGLDAESERVYVRVIFHDKIYNKGSQCSILGFFKWGF